MLLNVGTLLTFLPKLGCWALSQVSFLWNKIPDHPVMMEILWLMHLNIDISLGANFTLLLSFTGPDIMYSIHILS